MTLPNVVLMVADDHGLDGGCFSGSFPETPSLDRLAAEAVRFTQAFCTTASCAASRSVILTGRHNHANGTYGHTHGCHHFACFDDVVSLPVMLRQRGYRTARVGKFHHAPEAVFRFDTVLPGSGRDDVRMAETCREFISGQEPFFLYWCSHNPHRDGRVLESDPTRPNRFGNPDTDFPGDRERVYNPAELRLPHYLPDTIEARAEWAQYCQSVSRLDRGIGRLLDILHETGKSGNTLVIYISDNGAAFPVAKTTLYEPGMHLPCLIRAPGGTRTGGTTCAALMTWTDLTPTILNYCGGVDAGQEFHGESLRPVLEDPRNPPARSEIYASHTFHEITGYYPMRVVRSSRYKFIWNIAHALTYPSASDLWRCSTWQGTLRDGLETFGPRRRENYLHRPAFELYDLEQDPCETVNLADDAAYADMVADFKEKLRAFQKSTHDPWIHKWEYE